MSTGRDPSTARRACAPASSSVSAVGVSRSSRSAARSASTMRRMVTAGRSGRWRCVSRRTGRARPGPGPGPICPVVVGHEHQLHRRSWDMRHCTSRSAKTRFHQQLASSSRGHGRPCLVCGCQVLTSRDPRPPQSAALRSSSGKIIESLPTTWMSKGSPSPSSAMQTHSTCQPGRPRPSTSESHAGSPFPLGAPHQRIEDPPLARALRISTALGEHREHLLLAPAGDAAQCAVGREIEVPVLFLGVRGGDLVGAAARPAARSRSR